MTRVEKPQEIAMSDIHENPLLNYPHVIVTLMRQRAIKIVKRELAAQGRQIAISASAKRLPTVYGYREHVVAGGLVSYGVDLRWCYRRSASFVDKIRHGARPGDLPVEFPSKMLLSVNLKTAKALGLTVPLSLLVRADQVIE